MTTAIGSQDILAEDNAEKRAEIVEMLTTAYWMEIETVMSYIANSTNPDGVKAQEVVKSLQADVAEELAPPSSSPAASRSSTERSRDRWSSRRASASCSRPTTRSTWST